jgi:hypothetical protein
MLSKKIFFLTNCFKGQFACPAKEQYMHALACEVHALACDVTLTAWDLKFKVCLGYTHRYQRAKIDCLSFVMCPLLAQLIIGLFSFFFWCGYLQY